MDKMENDLLRLLLLQRYMPSENSKLENSKLEDSPTKVVDHLKFSECILGKEYWCKRFGNKIWMMENLNFIPINSEENTIRIDGNCYYTWNDAVRVSDYLENSSWHLPSAEEWNQLALDLGGTDTLLYITAGYKEFKFKENIIPKLDINSSGRYTDSSVCMDSHAYFWTSTTVSRTFSDNAFFRRIEYGRTLYSNDFLKSCGLSVRLVKNA